MNNRDHQIIKKVLLEIDIIEDLGELVKNLTNEFKENFNDIPWKGIAGMRDITAHKYQTLKMGDVWVTIENEIPNLKVGLKKTIVGKQI